MPILVVAAYHCEVSAKPTDSVDYQVRYFASDSIDEVVSRLRSEPAQVYKNSDGEDVTWLFDDIVTVELNPELKDGAEVIGFITGRPRETTDRVAQATG